MELTKQRPSVFLFSIFLVLILWMNTVTTTANTIEEEAVFFSALDLEREELASVRTAVENRDWKTAKQAWANHLSSRRSPTWV